MKLKVLIEKGLDGYLVASVPTLPGCYSQGKTKTELLKNIREAISLYLAPFPKELKTTKKHQVLTLAV